MLFAGTVSVMPLASMLLDTDSVGCAPAAGVRTESANVARPAGDIALANVHWIVKLFAVPLLVQFQPGGAATLAFASGTFPVNVATGVAAALVPPLRAIAENTSEEPPRTVPAGPPFAQCASLNGTYVNGERVDRAALTNGAEVRIGKFRLNFFVSPADLTGSAGS